MFGVTGQATDAVPPGFVALDPSHGPYHDLIGPVHVREGDEGPRFGLRVAERHENQSGMAHGGLLASLVDIALGRVIRAQADGEAASTVSLTLDFLRPVNPGEWLEASVTVDRLGRRLAFADCSLRAADREVVRARAVFALGG